MRRARITFVTQARIWRRRHVLRYIYLSGVPRTGLYYPVYTLDGVYARHGAVSVRSAAAAAASPTDEMSFGKINFHVKLKSLPSDIYICKWSWR